MEKEKKKFEIRWLNKENVLSFEPYIDPEDLQQTGKKGYYEVGLVQEDIAVGALTLHLWEDTGVLEILSLFVHPNYRGTGGGSLLLSAAQALALRLRAQSLAYRTVDGADETVGFLQMQGFEDDASGDFLLALRRSDLLGLATQGGEQISKIRSVAETYEKKGSIKCVDALTNAQKNELIEMLGSKSGSTGNPFTDGGLDAGCSFVLLKKGEIKSYITLRRTEDGSAYIGELSATKDAGSGFYGMIYRFFVKCAQAFGEEETLSIHPAKKSEAAIYELFFQKTDEIAQDAFVFQRQVRPKGPIDPLPESFFYLVPRMNALVDVLDDMGLDGEVFGDDPGECMIRLTVPEGEPERYISIVVDTSEDGQERFLTSIFLVWTSDGLKEEEFFRTREQVSTLISTQIAPKTSMILLRAVYPETGGMQELEEYAAFFKQFEAELYNLYGIRPLLWWKSAEGEESGETSDAIEAMAGTAVPDVSEASTGSAAPASSAAVSMSERLEELHAALLEAGYENEKLLLGERGREELIMTGLAETEELITASAVTTETGYLVVLSSRYLIYEEEPESGIEAMEQLIQKMQAFADSWAEESRLTDLIFFPESGFLELRAAIPAAGAVPAAARMAYIMELFINEQKQFGIHFAKLQKGENTDTALQS